MLRARLSPSSSRTTRRSSSSRWSMRRSSVAAALTPRGRSRPSERRPRERRRPDHPQLQRARHPRHGHRRTDCLRDASVLPAVVVIPPRSAVRVRYEVTRADAADATSEASPCATARGSVSSRGRSDRAAGRRRTIRRAWRASSSSCGDRGGRRHAWVCACAVGTRSSSGSAFTSAETRFSNRLACVGAARRPDHASVPGGKSDQNVVSRSNSEGHRGEARGSAEIDHALNAALLATRGPAGRGQGGPDDVRQRATHVVTPTGGRSGARKLTRAALAGGWARG